MTSALCWKTKRAMKYFRYYTTIVIGEDGRRYDLGKREYLPKDVMAVNAFPEVIRVEVADECVVLGDQ